MIIAHSCAHMLSVSYSQVIVALEDLYGVLHGVVNTLSHVALI